jgi:hypothetical protein
MRRNREPADPAAHGTVRHLRCPLVTRRSGRHLACWRAPHEAHQQPVIPTREAEARPSYRHDVAAMNVQRPGCGADVHAVLEQRFEGPAELWSSLAPSWCRTRRPRAPLNEAGIEVGRERDVLVVDVEDRPGSMGEVARRIGDAGVNVELVYTTFGEVRLVLGVDDIDEARSAL